MININNNNKQTRIYSSISSISSISSTLVPGLSRLGLTFQILSIAASAIVIQKLFNCRYNIACNGATVGTCTMHTMQSFRTLYLQLDEMGFCTSLVQKVKQCFCSVLKSIQISNSYIQHINALFPIPGADIL